MKLKTATLLALTATANNDVTGDRKVGGDGDRKVPKRHPLQRLWRLYQFSEEIILLHYYRSTMKKSRVDAIRELVKKWLYMGQRETFLRGTKKCGFYDSEYLPHGGPAPLKDGKPDYSHNEAIELQLTPEQEFSGYRPKSKVADQVPKSIEIFRVRDEMPESHRVRRHEVSTMEFEQERLRRDTVAANVQAQIDSYEFQLDGDFDDDSLENEENSLLRLKRDDPCKGIKQVFIGFRKWADRYIANCDGQATYKHMHLRALKFYNEFRAVCADIPRVDVSYVKPS